MRLRSQRPLHVQGYTSHPGEQGGGRIIGKSGGETQGVADPPKGLVSMLHRVSLL
jgi:hypothetical protein